MITMRRHDYPALRKVTKMSQTPYDAPLLTVGEVAGIMRVSNMTVYRLIKAGQLPAIRVGKNYRIRRTDLDRYLTDRTVHVEEES